MEAIEEKARKMAKKSLFGRNLDSMRVKNSAISVRSFTRLLDSPGIEKHDFKEQTSAFTIKKRKKTSSNHRKQKSLCLSKLIITFLMNISNFSNEKDAVCERLPLFSDGRKVDLCEIETKDTKDEKNTNFSFISAQELKRKSLQVDSENEEKRVAKNNERIMNYIRAKKMQRNIEKRGFLRENQGKKHCEQCLIF